MTSLAHFEKLARIAAVAMPLGGFKQSCLGRDRSLHALYKHALYKYADLKSVAITIRRRRLP